ncbi:MAG: hypothetical protein FK734_19685 [Asgard group archaeon]|nr:hypothetical protein [Asgard group archaeon]
MDKKELLGKKAFSNDKKRLGIIIAIEGSEKAITPIKKQHVIIHSQRFFRNNDIRINLPLSLIDRIIKNNIYFKIKEYFFQKKSEKIPEKARLNERLRKAPDRGYYYKKRSDDW